MKWHPSKALRNAVLIFLVVFLSAPVITAGLPNLNDLYRAVVAAGLAALLSFKREENPNGGASGGNTTSAILELG